jgi:trans-2-enoyl-CoA reductase
MAQLNNNNVALRKENAELRKEWQEQVQKATDEGYARTLQTIQLTKAKEIIKELLSSCFGYNSKTVNYEIKAEAEQFLSEVEK